MRSRREGSVGLDLDVDLTQSTMDAPEGRYVAFNEVTGMENPSSGTVWLELLSVKCVLNLSLIRAHFPFPPPPCLHGVHNLNWKRRLVIMTKK